MQLPTIVIPGREGWALPGMRATSAVIKIFHIWIRVLITLV